MNLPGTLGSVTNDSPDNDDLVPAEFKTAIESVLDKLFKDVPLASQPRGLVSLGCGGLPFLQCAYQYVTSETDRGAHLHDRPLLAILFIENELELQSFNQWHVLNNLPTLIILTVKSWHAGLLEHRLHVSGFALAELLVVCPRLLGKFNWVYQLELTSPRARALCAFDQLSDAEQALLIFLVKLLEQSRNGILFIENEHGFNLRQFLLASACLGILSSPGTFAFVVDDSYKVIDSLQFLEMTAAQVRNFGRADIRWVHELTHVSSVGYPPSIDQIGQWLDDNPADQFVLTAYDRVIGSLFAIRIDHIPTHVDENAKNLTHCNGGRIALVTAMLLNEDVDPMVQGQLLLISALQQFSSDTMVEKVVCFVKMTLLSLTQVAVGTTPVEFHTALGGTLCNIIFKAEPVAVFEYDLRAWPQAPQRKHTFAEGFMIQIEPHYSSSGFQRSGNRTYLSEWIHNAQNQASSHSQSTVTEEVNQLEEAQMTLQQAEISCIAPFAGPADVDQIFLGTLPQKEISSAVEFSLGTLPQKEISSAVEFSLGTLPQKEISSAVEFSLGTLPQKEISSAVEFSVGTEPQTEISSAVEFSLGTEPQTEISSAVDQDSPEQCQRSTGTVAQPLLDQSTVLPTSNLDIPQVTFDKCSTASPPYSASIDGLRPLSPDDDGKPIGVLTTAIVQVFDGLSMPPMDASTSLMALGFDSESLLELKHTLQMLIDIELPTSTFYTHPTLGELADYLNELCDGQLRDRMRSSSQLTDYPVFDDSILGDEVERLACYTEPDQLSASQTRMWFTDVTYSSHKGLLNLPISVTFNIKESYEAWLTFSLLSLIQSQESLRTCFTIDAVGFPRQFVVSGSESFCCTQTLLTTDVFHAQTVQQSQHFQLLSLRPAYSVLVVATSAHQMLCYTVHHILCDGLSVLILLNDLCSGLASIPSLYLEKPRHSFLEAINREVASEADKQFWIDTLCGADSLQLPGDKQTATITYDRSKIEFQLGTSVVAAVKQTATLVDTTKFTVLLATFGHVLSSYCAQSSILIGCPVSGRTNSKCSEVVGCFINTVMLHLQMKDNSCAEYILQCRKVLRAALDHQEIPFQNVVDEVVARSDLDRAKICQVLLNMWQTSILNGPDGRKIIRQSVASTGVTGIDLSVSVLNFTPNVMDSFCEFNLDVFYVTTVRQFIAVWRTKIMEIQHVVATQMHKIQTPLEIQSEEILIARSKEQQAVCLIDYKIQSEVLQGQMLRHSHALALMYNESSIVYSDLCSRVQSLALPILSHSVQGSGKPMSSDTPMPICMTRGLDLIASIYTLQTAGFAYVPLDPDYPVDRLSYCLGNVQSTSCFIDDSAPKMDLAVFDYASVRAQSMLYPHSRHTHARFQVAHDLAYMIYTSGSTGLPKGVCINQKSAVSSVLDTTTRMPCINATYSMYQAFNFIFDVSVMDMGLAFFHGAYLVLSVDRLQMPAELFHYRIVNTNIVAALVNNLGPKQLRQMAIVENISTCGENVQPSTLGYLLGDGLPVYNMYGPSETTIFSTGHCMNIVYNNANIGLGLAHEKVYSLSDKNEMTPFGVAGQLCIGGHSLARGYLKRLELTQDRFAQNVVQPPELVHKQLELRLYATGDFIKIQVDGKIDYIGRRDFQVKIRGFRIELSEIENVILSIDIVKQCNVLVITGAWGSTLVAFCALSEQNAQFPSMAPRTVGEKLPSYMVPTAFIVLNAIPTSYTGKADRKAMEKVFVEWREGPPTEAQLETVAEVVEDLESSVIAVWKSLLPVATVGLDDNFFDIGGNSILALRLKFLFEAELNIDVELTDIFKYTTVRLFTQNLKESQELATVVEPDGSFNAVSAALKTPFLMTPNFSFFSKEIEPSSAVSFAVLGFSGEFSGCSSIDEFWANICRGEECITHTKPDSLIMNDAIPDDVMHPNYIGAIGKLSNVADFDHLFWGLSMKDAKLMDPQIRKFTEQCWIALELSSNILKRDSLSCGVFAGSGHNTYFDEFVSDSLLSDYECWEAGQLNDAHVLTTRVSYMLDLRGPSVTVGTACSTSLVSIAEACKSLKVGACDFALAGAVSFPMPSKRGYIHQEGMIFSSDGHCRVFDHKASGTILGAGCATVALKTLSKASENEDPIHAIVTGYATNNDGHRKVGYTAPSIVGQAECIKLAHTNAGIKSSAINYVECHGTGTKIGDPIEIAALNEAFAESAKRRKSCIIGSVKANIGHADSASGMAGFIKVCKMLDARLIVGQINFDKMNPFINNSVVPFVIPWANAAWNSRQCQAGISSFGIGGTNAHVILLESTVGGFHGHFAGSGSVTSGGPMSLHMRSASLAWSAASSTPTPTAKGILKTAGGTIEFEPRRKSSGDTRDLLDAPTRGPKLSLPKFQSTGPVLSLAMPKSFKKRKVSTIVEEANRKSTFLSPFVGMGPVQRVSVLPWSARSASACSAYGTALHQFMADHPNMDLTSIANELVSTRVLMDYRSTISCASIDEAISALSRKSAVIKSAPPSTKLKAVFVFPGQGAQQVNMGQALFNRAPAFTAAMNECMYHLANYTGINAGRIIYTKKAGLRNTALLNQTEWTQVSLYSLAYSIGHQLITLGITASAFAGHSVGQYAAMSFSLTSLKVQNMIQIIYNRGRLMQMVPKGSMLAATSDLLDVINVRKMKLSIAAINAPGTITLAGTLPAIRRARKASEVHRKPSKTLATSHAFHSREMEVILDQFKAMLSEYRLTGPTESAGPLISNIDGEFCASSTIRDSEYWAMHLAETVMFSKGIDTLAAESENSVFIEVGPGRAMSRLIQSHPQIPKERVLVSQFDQETLFDTIGRLWCVGYPVDWAKLGIHGNQALHRNRLPGYQFDRISCWMEKMAKERRKSEKTDNTLVYVTVWNQLGSTTAWLRQALQKQSEAVLVFTTHRDFEALHDGLSRIDGLQFLLVIPDGAEFAIMDGKSAVKMPVADSTMFRKLAQTITSSGFKPNYIINAWFMQQSAYFGLVSQSLTICFSVLVPSLSCLQSYVIYLPSFDSFSTETLHALHTALKQPAAQICRLITVPESFDLSSESVVLSAILGCNKEYTSFAISDSNLHIRAEASVAISNVATKGHLNLPPSVLVIGKPSELLLKALLQLSEHRVIVLLRSHTSLAAIKSDTLEVRSVDCEDSSEFDVCITELNLANGDATVIFTLPFDDVLSLTKLSIHEQRVNNVCQAIDDGSINAVRVLTIAEHAPEFMGKSELRFHLPLLTAMLRELSERVILTQSCIIAQCDMNSAELKKDLEEIFAQDISGSYLICEICTTEESLGGDAIDFVEKEGATRLENDILKMFQEVLGEESLSVDDAFFEVGGNSLNALRLVGMLKSAFQCNLDVGDINEYNTPARLASFVTLGAGAQNANIIVPLLLNKGATQNAVFIHGGSGSVYIYAGLVKLLPSNWNYYGIHYPYMGVDKTGKENTLQELAGLYNRELIAFQSDGPYYLIGHSFGGTMAYEMARQLTTQGHRVPYIVFIDTWARYTSVIRDADAFRKIQRKYFAEVLSARYGMSKENLPEKVMQLVLDTVDHLEKMLLEYETPTTKQKIIQLRCMDLDELHEEHARSPENFENCFWQCHTTEKVTSYPIPGSHHEIMYFEEYLINQAKLLTEILHRKQSVSQEAVGATKLENDILKMFIEVLGDEKITTNDNFFDVGGNSLNALRLINLIKNMYHCNMDIGDIVEHKTPAQLASFVTLGTGSSSGSIIVPLLENAGAVRNAIFIHGGSGSVYIYAGLVKLLPTNWNYYGIHYPYMGMDKVGTESTLGDLAALYISELLNFQPDGPYIFIGHSFGGTMAYEMARQLTEAGHSVPYIAFIDTWARYTSVIRDAEAFRKIQHKYFVEVLGSRYGIAKENMPEKVIQMVLDTVDHLEEMLLQYQTPYTQQKIFQLRCAKLDELHIEHAGSTEEFENGFWQFHTSETVTAFEIPGSHHEIMYFEEYLTEQAKILSEILQTDYKKVAKRSPSMLASPQKPHTEARADQLLDDIQSILQITSCDRNDDFFSVGGDARTGNELLALLKKKYAIQLDISDLLEYNSASLLACYFEIGLALKDTSVVSKYGDTGSQGQQGTVIFIHSDDGSGRRYKDLISSLPQTFSYVTVTYPWIVTHEDDELAISELAELADFYAEQLLAHAVTGPCILCGHSVGGNIAIEIARNFTGRGVQVKSVVLMDSWAKLMPPALFTTTFAQTQKQLLHAELVKRFQLSPENMPDKLMHEMVTVMEHMQSMLYHFKAEPLPAGIKVCLLKCKQLDELHQCFTSSMAGFGTNFWASQLKTNIEVHTISSGNHQSMLSDEQVLRGVVDYFKLIMH